MKYIEAIKNPKIIKLFGWKEIVELVQKHNGEVTIDGYKIYEVMGDIYVCTDWGTKSFKPKQVLAVCPLDGVYPIDIDIVKLKYLLMGEKELPTGEEEESTNDGESTEEVAQQEPHDEENA